MNNLQKDTSSPEVAIFSENSIERRHISLKLIIAIVLCAILLSCAGSIAIVEIWPSVGAELANQTRNFLGPQIVARMEAVVFQIHDTVKHTIYHYGVEQAEAPWNGGTVQPSLTPATTLPNNHANTAMETVDLKKSPYPAEKTMALTDQYLDNQGIMRTKTATITSTPTPFVWQISNLTPFGTLDGEGIWLPYLHDKEGNVVAKRTFLQPDPERPYTIVAIVAFDLTRTRLNFVLGFLEPSLPDGPKGDGLIPEEDRREGILLATFNGGFRSANGQFGAMADGIIALPPKTDIATVGIYRDGEVRIGNWGENIFESPDLVSWRQNCRLIIQDGQISPRVYNNSITDWGASISNEIVTRRSAMGLNQDAKVLYYFAGPSLSMPTLADAMMTAGVHQGMLLDINNFWVLFAAIHSVDGGLIAEPLLPNEMKDKVDRYLGASPDDFFYVTAIEKE